jgi:hypothetical protein
VVRIVKLKYHEPKTLACLDPIKLPLAQAITVRSVTIEFLDHFISKFHGRFMENRDCADASFLIPSKLNVDNAKPFITKYLTDLPKPDTLTDELQIWMNIHVCGNLKVIPRFTP